MKAPRYSNPELPEDINVTPEHPLRELGVLVGGIVAVVVVVVGTLGLAADTLASRIPFAFERELASRFLDEAREESEAQRALASLAERLSLAMGLPEDMVIEAHLTDDDTINAYATLGGHVFVMRGLVESLESENALAMVLAHEIAHIEHRHPVRALGRGAVVMLALLALAGVGDDGLAAELVGDAGTLALLRFNRAQEREADRTALAAVEHLYGHTAGALELYEDLLDPAREAAGGAVPALLSTHPLTTDRIRDLETLARERGWMTTGTTVALPEALR